MVYLSGLDAAAQHRQDTLNKFGSTGLVLDNRLMPVFAVGIAVLVAFSIRKRMKRGRKK